ncbi:MAG: methenyltetrahydromethanopterin cyclohydrolase [Hyphomicrobium aestuarii]|nr:methenyltetrahydromethanopterin cyclohydrolase [Hyphomicrobium aestuarii]
MMSPDQSVNARAEKLVTAIVADAGALRCRVGIGAAGERIIDMGASVPGSIEAGRRLAEVCMGGYGNVAVHMASGLDGWPLGVTVHALNPVVACLASQYGGWTLKDDASGFFALGSGPARALARKEALFAELGYADQHHAATIVIEGDGPPPAALSKQIAADCGISPASLSVLYAPTGSLAGGVQIAARVLEVGLHKAHELGFPLSDIIDGVGTAPIAPPIPDFIQAMGRTNDAIIYGGRVHLHVTGTDAAAEALATHLPSSGSAAYGRPFAEIFAEVNGDFYKIDGKLFSPAMVTVSNITTGRSFKAGAIAADIVGRSFG